MYQFNNEKKEVTFSQYNTPTPWMNYLSNGTFHTMMSQAGGAVAFYKSPKIWRLNHYRFYNLPTDRSGFYTYIKDGEDFWCPTNEPCYSKPEKWTSTHGMGYTRFEAEKNGVSASAVYFVGKYKNSLIWNLKLTSKEDKKITVFPYVELSMMEAVREFQWQGNLKHHIKCYNRGDILIYKYKCEGHPKLDETPLVYFAADVPIAAFDCDRDEFVGTYRSEENPVGVVEGKCKNSVMFGGDPCFAFQIDVDLKAGEEKEINIFFGTEMTEEEIEKAVSESREKGFVQKSFEALADEWEDYLSKFRCEIPDKDAETMINIWNPYQAQRNYLFSRDISYYTTGTVRGVGVRDTAQDILAVVPFDLRKAKDKLNLILAQQYNDGHTNHHCFPIEGLPPYDSIRSDNHLWLIMTAYHIVIEEGKLDYLDEVVEFYDGGEGTVWEHLKKSIEFTENNCGERGFPLMFRSDWNDAMLKICRKGKGESIWTSMQFGIVLKQIAELAELRGEDSKKYLDLYEDQKKRINTIAWDGQWYIRAINDDGLFIGSDKEPQAKIWLNAQTWAVMSGMCEGDKGRIAMDSVAKYLDSPLGIKKVHPPVEDYPSKEDPLMSFNKGCSENAGIFCHSNTWAVIAECILGRPERAYKYYHQLLPMVAQKTAGASRYRAEPYIYSSNIFGPDNDKFGLANMSWLSGTAAWMYIAVTQYMFGIRATWNGLEVKPCLPDEMLPAKVKRTFRGKTYEITIESNDKFEIKEC